MIVWTCRSTQENGIGIDILNFDVSGNITALCSSYALWWNLWASISLEYTIEQMALIYSGIISIVSTQLYGTPGHSWLLNRCFGDLSHPNFIELFTCKWDGYGQPYHLPGRGMVKRPSDALLGKPFNGTATDWVTRGSLNLIIRRVSLIIKHEGSMYSRAIANSCLKWNCEQCHETKDNTEKVLRTRAWGTQVRSPNLMGFGDTNQSGNISSLACTWFITNWYPCFLNLHLQVSISHWIY